MAVLANYLNRRFPQTQIEEVGIGGFTLFARVRDVYRRVIEAPTTALEDGSVVGDHLIVRPISITIEGDVSDVHVRPSPIIKAFRRLQAEVGNISAQYLPGRTQSQLSRVSALANTIADAVRRIDAAIDAGEQALEYFGNRDSTAISLQREFLNKMDSYIDGRVLIDIDMPNRLLKNMAIVSLSLSTDNQANSTSFTLEAQQISFADLQYSEIKKHAPATDGQLEPRTDRGAQSGVPQTDESLLSKIFEAVQ